MAKTNLKTIAYNSIRQKIVTCEYAPGMFLNEEFLTNELHLSRTPIRDALGRLEQEGLVTIKPKRGIFITPLTVRSINMIFEVRKLYEPYILATYGSMIPVEKLKEFYAIFSNKGSAGIYSTSTFFESDSAFHSLIVDSCTNTYIHQNYALIQTCNERFRHMTGDYSRDRLVATCKEHLAIILPCLEGNWAEASAKMSYHLDESKKSSFELVFNSSDENGIEL